MTIRALDLFCGAGGSSLGARAAGVDVVCGVDAAPLAITAYQANIPHARALNHVLSETPEPAVLEAAGEIQMILASPECTSHTCARGNRPGDEDSLLTARHVLGYARVLTPRWIVIENVMHMRSWRGYAPLLDELRGLGYKVEPLVLDAADFGVPQNRRRLFLLCDRDRVPPKELPSIGHQVATARERVLRPGDSWPSRPLDNGRRAAGTLARAERAIAALGRRVPFLIVYYGSDGAGGWQSLDRPLRTVTTLDRFGLVTWEGETPMLRMLQVPELGRAMGFPDEFFFPAGNRRDRIRLLGNAVCPPVMTAIVRALTEDAHVSADVKAAE